MCTKGWGEERCRWAPPAPQKKNSSSISHLEHDELCERHPARGDNLRVVSIVSVSVSHPRRRRDVEEFSAEIHVGECKGCGQRLSVSDDALRESYIHEENVKTC